MSDSPYQILRHFAAVEGDFSIDALAMRLLAPNPESLYRILPDTSPEKSIENWDEFAKAYEWHQEAQSIKYVANFVHEFWHALQYTTLFQCMAQMEFHYRIASNLYGHLMSMKNSGANWPPKLPLLHWLANVDNSAYKYTLEVATIGDLMLRFYLGDEVFVQDLCQRMGDDIATRYVEPFNPRIYHLELGQEEPTYIRAFREVPITSTMLLESQATMIEWRYIGTFYGEDILQEFLVGSIRPDYDLLSLISRSTALLYWVPSLIDWSFEGHAYLPDKRLDWKMNDYSAFLPPWRFVRLFKAAMSLRNLESLNDFRSLQRYSEIKAIIFRQAGLVMDDRASVAQWLHELPESVVKKVLVRNFATRERGEPAFAYPEANLSWIYANTYVPIVMYRDSSIRNTHNQMYSPKDDILDSIHLSHHAQRTFDLYRFIEGVVPVCPFCVGVEYCLPDGRRVTRRPPLGTTGFITKDLIVSPGCSCAWAFNFREAWGFAPHQMERM